MPRRGIHPLMRAMTCVMKNGATFKVYTPVRFDAPYILPSDPTTHPTWTGEGGLQAAADGRSSKFMSKFEDLTAGPSSPPPQQQQ